MATKQMGSLKRILNMKKKIKAEEIGIALYQMCIDKETIEGILNRLRKNLPEDIKLVDEEKLIFHSLALLIFAIDYSTFSTFGNTNIKNKILDEFYRIVKETFMEEYELLSIEVLAFSNAFKDKDKSDHLLSLSLYFSECITQSEQQDLSISMISSIEFGTRVTLIKEFLNGINKDYKII